MQPHQIRVIDEKSELATKLFNLNEFIESSPVFQSLPAAEKSRLTRQRAVMRDYVEILRERIAAFQ